MWGWGLNWIDVVLFVASTRSAAFGIGVGFHRYLTHGRSRPSGGCASRSRSPAARDRGAPTQWVADHRRHHQFSDMEGDPHSPWRYGETFWGLTKGLWYSHVGWLFYREMSNQQRFAPDLVADKDIQRSTGSSRGS
jgi:stearoyl-CoA desaturase (delta-9 desaturase)